MTRVEVKVRQARQTACPATRQIDGEFKVVIIVLADGPRCKGCDEALLGLTEGMRNAHDTRCRDHSLIGSHLLCMAFAVGVNMPEWFFHDSEV
jgi:hypothetical protein